MNILKGIALLLFGAAMLTGALCPTTAMADNELATSYYNDGVARFETAKKSAEKGMRVDAHANFLAARQLFQQAYNTDGSTEPEKAALLLYNMARASEEAAAISGGREVPQAIVDFRAYLRVKPDDTEGLQKVNRLMEVASQQGLVEFKGHPSDARVFVNGIELRGSAVFNPGTYTVQYKIGSQPVTQQGFYPPLVVKAKQPMIYHWQAPEELRRQSVVVPPVEASTGISRGTLGWILVGSGAAALATGGALYALSYGDSDEYAKTGDQETADRGRALYKGSLAAFGVGAAAAGFGTYFLLTQEDSGTALMLTPTGVGIAGTW